jgi:hypothetical protein
MTAEESFFKAITPPKVVGGYRLGKKLKGTVQFNICHKPKWIHRQFMRIFFGLYWFDFKSE